MHFAQVRLDLFRKLPLNIFESLSNGRNGKHRQQVQPSSCLARPAPHAMGIPDELLVDQRQISPALRCVICTEVFVEPVASGSSTCLEQTYNQLLFFRLKRSADHLGLPSKKGHEWTSGVFFLAMIPLRSCQHVFCLSCITRALANKAECPLCREEMHVFHLRRCQPIQALVDEVQVPRKYVCRRTVV